MPFPHFHGKLPSLILFFVHSHRKLVGANQAPKKGEQVDDKVSHRFQDFVDKKNTADEQRKNASKKKNKNKFKPSVTEDPDYPQLDQKPNESDRNYIQRLEEVIRRSPPFLRPPRKGHRVSVLGSEICVGLRSIRDEIRCQTGRE